MNYTKLYKLAKMVLNLAEVNTDKGVLISDGELEVGVEAFIEDENGELVAAPDGEYKAEDDKVYVVVEGKIAEIREPEPEEAPEEQEPEEAPEEQPEAEVEQEEQEPEEAPAEDEKDNQIAELQAKIDELNNIIAEKDEEIGKLKAELEKSDAEPAEEQLKSQKPVKSGWSYKPRF